MNPTTLIESPRHWNCGLFRYADKLWMSYRFHLKQHSGRCATAIVNAQLFEELRSAKASGERVRDRLALAIKVGAASVSLRPTAAVVATAALDAGRADVLRVLDALVARQV